METRVNQELLVNFNGVILYILGDRWGLLFFGGDTRILRGSCLRGVKGHGATWEDNLVTDDVREGSNYGRTIMRTPVTTWW